MAKSKILSVERSSIQRRSDWRNRICCRRSKPNRINSPAVKKLLRLDEVQRELNEGNDGDSCWSLGPSTSYQRGYEAKIAELEEQLRQAKEEADFYFQKAEEAESDIQNLHLQHEKAKIAPLPAEGSSENDEEATSSECSTGQSAADKWTCALCERNEASVVVVPCSHLCLCFDCAVDINPEKCPVCDAQQTDLLFVRKC